MEKTLLDEFREYVEINQPNETMSPMSLIILPLLQYENINEQINADKIDSLLNSKNIKKLKF